MKLVRDRIPAIAWRKGDDPSFRVADEAEKKQLLLNKIQEEVSELLEAMEDGNQGKIVSELADVIEVVQAIGNYYQVDVNYKKKVKAELRGGFNDWIVME